MTWVAVLNCCCFFVRLCIYVFFSFFVSLLRLNCGGFTLVFVGRTAAATPQLLHTVKFFFYFFSVSPQRKLLWACSTEDILYSYRIRGAVHKIKITTLYARDIYLFILCLFRKYLLSRFYGALSLSHSRRSLRFEFCGSFFSFLSFTFLAADLSLGVYTYFDFLYLVFTVPFRAYVHRATTYY